MNDTARVATRIAQHVPVEVTADGIRLRDDLHVAPPQSEHAMTEFAAVPPAAERDIEHLLRQGKSAQWVATNLGEPMPLVMKVLDRLRKEAAQPADADEDDEETPAAAPVAAGARPLASVPRATEPGSAPPSIEALVSAAARSTSKRTKALGQKLEDLARVIRQRLNDERVAAEAAEKTRREREAAAAEVARLEAELRAAREKAKPFNRSRQGVQKTMTAKAAAASTANAQRNNERGEFPCRKCGRVCATIGGRGRHEAACKGDAA